MEKKVEETEPSGSSFLNRLMVQRRGDRGDLVGSLAWWGFWAFTLYFLICGCFGGSTAALKWGAQVFTLVIPSINAVIITGLLVPIALHVVKSLGEKKLDNGAS